MARLAAGFKSEIPNIRIERRGAGKDVCRARRETLYLPAFQRSERPGIIVSQRRFKRIRYLERISVAGSLCMVFIACVTSPVTTDIFRHLGASSFQFGLLNGLPLIMLAMQFAGAYWTNRMRTRKRWFMVLIILARLLYLPVAILPFLGGASREAVVAAMIALIALGSGIANLTIPMWYSWMSDLIPRRVLNSYWGNRQRSLTLTLTLAALAVTVLTFYGAAIPIDWLFLILVLVGCTAGTIDILLFRAIREPPNVTTDAHPWTVLMQPLRDRDYRSMVVFQCVFNGLSMMAAAFMLVYVLDVLRIPLWQASLVWCVPGLGMAVVSPFLGRLSDQYGHRPVMTLCVALKPVVALAFLLISARTAVAVLTPVLFVDAMLNAGLAISTNGYMLKKAPRANRSMFIAAMSALTGVSMGFGAILGGVFLQHTAGFELAFAGRVWGNFQLLFFINVILRVLCIPLARRVREPASAPSRVVMAHIMGTWPLRMLAFPVGFYRRMRFPDER